MHIYDFMLYPDEWFDRRIKWAPVNIYGDINKLKSSRMLCTVFQSVPWIKQFYMGNIETIVWSQRDYSIESHLMGWAMISMSE